VRIYLNGQPLETKILFDQNTEPIHHPKTLLRIGAGGGLRFLGNIEDVAIYNRALSPEEAAILSVRESVAQIVSTSCLGQALPPANLRSPPAPPPNPPS